MRVRSSIVAAGAAGLVLASGLLAAAGPADAQTSLGNRVAAMAAPAPVVRLEAETRTAQRGTTVVADAGASGGFVVGDLSHRDWLRYDDIAVVGSRFTLLCFASAAPPGTEVATVDIRLGDRHATPTQSIVLRTVGAPSVRQLAIGVGPVPDGVHRLYLTVRSPSRGPDFALDYVTFTAFPPPPSFNC